MHFLSTTKLVFIYGYFAAGYNMKMCAIDPLENSKNIEKKGPDRILKPELLQNDMTRDIPFEKKINKYDNGIKM